MAALPPSKRRMMPASQFAGPNKSFPINDKMHARMAIGAATRSAKAGNISSAQASRIKAKARKKLSG